MAKKKKGARTAASRGTRKKAASARGGARKKSVRRAVPASKTGLENPREINLTPIKAQIKAHIERLERMKYLAPEAQQVLKTLQVASLELSSPCGPTMVISLVEQ